MMVVDDRNDARLVFAPVVSRACLVKGKIVSCLSIIKLYRPPPASLPSENSYEHVTFGDPYRPLRLVITGTVHTPISMKAFLDHGLAVVGM